MPDQQGIYFDVVGVEKVQANIERKAGEFRRLLAKEVIRSLINIDREAKKAAPVNVGQLRSGIHFTVATTDNITGIVGSYAKHAAFMEFGTGPMGASTNRQPLPPWYSHGETHRMPVRVGVVGFAGKKKFEVVPGLANWAHKHGMNAMALALAIAGKGKKRRLPGLRARPYFYPAAIAESKQFPDRVEAAMRKALTK